MTQYWTIISLADGSVIAPCFATASTGQHPKDAGWDWDATKHRATRIAGRPDPVVQVFDGTAWVDDLAKLKTVAIQKIKDEAEQLKMTMMTSGGAKKEEYAANKAEVRDADQLGGARLTTLSALKLITGGLEARFPQAYANAQAFGDTVPDALNRFRGGIARSAPCPAISAREAKLCADIRAATTKLALTTAMTKNKWPV